MDGWERVGCSLGRACTHAPLRTTADARRRSRPRTQQALHSRWNFTALEELCTLVVVAIPVELIKVIVKP